MRHYDPEVDVLLDRVRRLHNRAIQAILETERAITSSRAALESLRRVTERASPTPPEMPDGVDQ